MNILKQRWATAARRLGAAFLAAGLGFAALSAHAEDDPPGRVGRLAEVRGQVWFLEEGQGEWQSAVINRPLTTSDRIATDNGARAEIQIGSTIVRLDQASDLEVNRLDDDRIELTLHDGSAAVRVREPEVAREVQINTAEGRFTPRGPGLFRVDHGDRGAMAAATQGEVDFESNDSQLTLRPGQRAELWIDSNDRRTHYNWTTLPNDEFEQWVRSGDARDTQYAAAPRRPISPEMTGAEDLERNGSWDNHPDYGAVWYPTTVVAGWAPYRYGHWAWVRPWGWTWVDDAPWGFAPFHYGRWVNWRGRWGWTPGTYVRRPVYAPAMVAWVGGGNVSVSINIGGGRPVGWVPLAPREVYYPAYRVSPVYVKQVNVTNVHITQNVIVKPTRVVYANSNVRGGVTMVSSDALTRRQAIGTATRVNDDVAIREVRNHRGAGDAVAVAPPAPANASQAPRQVRAPGREAAVPVPRSAVPVNRNPNNDNDRPRAGQPVEPRNNNARDNPRDNPRDSQGAPRADAPKADRPRADAPRADAPRGDSPRADAPRADSPRANSPRGDAPRVERPPLSSRPQREPGQAAGRDAPQGGTPQPRRETNDTPPPRTTPREQPQREQPQRDRDQRDQLQQPRQPTPQPQPQPAPRAVPQREDQPRQERQERQPDRQPDRQPQKQVERQQPERPTADRQPDRQEQRHERREDKREKRDKRDGPNA